MVIFGSGLSAVRVLPRRMVGRAALPVAGGMDTLHLRHYRSDPATAKRL
jgi:hypothetical protein